MFGRGFSSLSGCADEEEFEDGIPEILDVIELLRIVVGFMDVMVWKLPECVDRD